MSAPRIDRRKFLKRVFFGALAAVAGTAAYSVLIEPTWILVTRRTIRIPGLPRHLDGAVVAHLSDFHLGIASASYVSRCVDRTLDLEPDLVALTGDYVGHSTPEVCVEAARILGRLEAPLGVFAVSGNHDWSVYSSGASKGLPRVLEELAGRGIRVIDNEAQAFLADGRRAWLVGLGDLWAGECRVAGTLDPLPEGEPRIVLSHNPDSAPEIAEHGADLILSGHTHGGQVDLPFYGPPLLPVRRREFYSGLYDLPGGTRLYVSNGLGYLRRIRFRARPEIALHRLST